MTSDPFLTLLLIFIIVLLVYFGYEAYFLISFMKRIKKTNAILVTDSLYLVCIVMVWVIYFGILADYLVDIYLNYNMYANTKTPFITYILPIMAISYDLLVVEGLFAYENYSFIGRRIRTNISKVKIKKYKKNKFTNRVKAKLIVTDEKTGKRKEITLRATDTDFEKFKAVAGKRIIKESHSLWMFYESK